MRLARDELIFRPVKLSADQTEASQRKIILLLCCVAALRVFVFSAAFPFFGVVDEQAHFDLVTHYAQAAPPRTMPHITAEALPYIVWFNTPEYLWTPESQPHGRFAPPPWQLPVADAEIRLAPREKFWRETVINYEVAQPPLYYTLAGGWWRVGGWLRLSDGDRLLWLRLLNMALLAALVWLGGGAARKFFPENRFVQIAVPALIAFFPQSIFSAINNDVMSPLAFGAAFVLLVDFFGAEISTPRSAAATGLALAAAFLTKISNLPLLALAAVFLALKIFRLWRGGKLRAAAPALAVVAACAGLPMVAWLAWCKIWFGDFTGTAQKIHFLNWINVPVAAWFHHPIFSVAGFWYFLKGNLASFWFGEQMWYRQPLTAGGAELAMVILSLVALAFVLAALLRPSSSFTAPQRTVLWLGLACLAAALAFFALLSVKYDFQDCFYPSRAEPFFVSGRLMLGLLVPFLILFACGLDRLLANCRERVKFLVLFTLLAFLLASEITVAWPVFASEYNWFHL